MSPRLCERTGQRLVGRRPGAGCDLLSAPALDTCRSGPYARQVPFKASPVTALPGPRDLVGDRYQLEEELGTGGQGTVYRALDRRLGRHVAVKLLRPEFTPLIGADRFQREIAIAAPGIATPATS